MAKERSIFRMIVTNFWNSIKPRRIWGVCVGKDYNGTEYYEIPLTESSTSSTRSRPSRWFMPPRKNDFQQDIPPEWEAWLRYRRKEPPTEEEIERNLERARAVLANVEKLNQESGKALEIVAPTVTSKEFPIYEELEGMPGGRIKPEPPNKLIK